MKIHEYQAKNILAEYGAPVPQGHMVTSISSAEEIAQKLPGNSVVVKAQIHAGGRGKGGGVKVCEKGSGLRETASSILGMQLITPQTGAEGQSVQKLLIEQCLNIKKELYLSLLVDRTARRITVIASTEGGMDIEEVAASAPQKILKETAHPVRGLQSFQAQRMAFNLGLHEIDPKLIRKAANFFMLVFRVFCEKDASLLEINPLIITREHDLVALDCKIAFDDNALFRHPDITNMRDVDEEDPQERKAENNALNYVRLDGRIGCMVNGAGLAMATMDILQHYGGQPANFLDVGGTATSKRVEHALRLITMDPNVNCIFINIFGGIVRCDVIADGIVEAFRTLGMNIPIVARLLGSNAEKASRIINNSGLGSILSMEEELVVAVTKAVEFSKNSAPNDV